MLNSEVITFTAEFCRCHASDSTRQNRIFPRTRPRQSLLKTIACYVAIVLVIESHVIEAAQNIPSYKISSSQSFPSLESVKSLQLSAANNNGKFSLLDIFNNPLILVVRTTLLGYLQKLVNELHPAAGNNNDAPFHLRNMQLERNTRVQSVAICGTCKIIIQTVRWAYDIGIPAEFFVAIAHEACVTFHIESAAVCSGLIALFRKEFEIVLSTSPYSASNICSIFLVVCPVDKTSPAASWTVALSRRRPLPAKAPRAKRPVNAVVTNLRILHLTDIHLDLLYQPGSAGICSDLLCCRGAKVSPGSGVPAAGYWGFNRGFCDSPPQLVDAVLAHIARTDNIRLILWTGDALPHDIWKQNRTYQLKIAAMTNNAIKRHFPNTPVFATLGNHEGFPVNQFLQPGAVDANGDTQAWLYNSAAAQWIGWGPDESQRQNILKGGFYACRPPAFPNLKIISLNTNYCSKLNFWLILNDDDAAGQLAWLVDELNDSEQRATESVFIISHITPTGGSCIKPWRDNYFRIVARYKDTIKGTFFGHSHNDEYSVTYDPATLSQPTSVAYISPSVTTFNFLNPGYRVFIVDGDISSNVLPYTVLDHETYVANLTSANAKAALAPGGVGSPSDLQWQLEYTARQQYGLPDMSPKSWSSLTRRLRSQPALFKIYYNNYYKQQESKTQQACDATCQASLLCDTQANACSASGDGLE